MPIHLADASKGDIAENVIACGDPYRVELLQQLLEDSRVVNKHRGLLTVTGYYKGTRITLSTHGIGAASAAIVFEELHQLGAKRIVRLGTTGGIRKDTRLGDVVVATAAAYPEKGCALGQYMPGLCGATGADPVLTSQIMQALKDHGVEYKYGPVFSSDAFYAESGELAEVLERYGIVSIEMEAAVLFALGWMRGFQTAAVLVVSDVLHTKELSSVFLTTKELSEIFIKVAKAIMDVYSKFYKG